MSIKQMLRFVKLRLVAPVLLSVFVLLSNGCSTSPQLSAIPTLPQKPSVTMPPTSTEIWLTVEKNMQRWAESQQARQSRLMDSIKHGPVKPSGH